MIIDFHSHILPEMDDGSRSVEQSYRMLRLSAEQGIDAIAATPHFLPERESPERFLARRDAAAGLLSDRPERPRLLLGAEVSYFPGIGRCTEIRALRVGDSPLLLLEPPFSVWSLHTVEEICGLSASLRLTPVIAHYERYLRIPGAADAIARLLDAGCLLQSNAEAFLHPGRVRRSVLHAFRDGEISFLGSDCHSDTHRAPNLGAALPLLSARLGPEALEAFHQRAGRLLFSHGD